MALSIVGCKKDNSKAPSGSVIEVEASINAAQSEPNKSKAIISGTTWVNNATFSAWVVPYQDVTGSTAGVLRTVDNYEDNVLYTYNSGSGTFSADRQTYYPTTDAKIDIYAISPSITGATISSIASYPFTIDADQSTADALITKNDLMTGKGEGTASINSGKAAITFTHRLSKVLVVFSLPSKYQNNNITSINSVEVVGINPSTTVNLTDLTATAPTPTGAAVDVLARQVIVPDAGANPAITTYTYEAVVTPNSTVAATKSIVRIKLNVENIGLVTFDCLTNSDHTYQAQKQTQINVSIGDEQQIVVDDSNITINGWGTPVLVNGSTTKLSKMIFDLDGLNLCTDATGADNATIAIEGISGIEAKVKFVVDSGDATKGQYILEYDHGANFAGNLEAVTIRKGATVIGTAFTGLNYQIKYDPTIDAYNTVIATITFTDASNSTIAKK